MRVRSPTDRCPTSRSGVLRTGVLRTGPESYGLVSYKQVESERLVSDSGASHACNRSPTFFLSSIFPTVRNLKHLIDDKQSQTECPSLELIWKCLDDQSAQDLAPGLQANQPAMPRKPKMKAAAYLRISSKANCSEGKHSLQRQEKAIQSYAKKAGLVVEKSALFSDLGVSGTIPVQNRDAFQKMLTYVEQKNITTILFEDSSRLARCVVVQELALQLLQELGVSGISCASPGEFVGDCPTSRLVRQLLGAVAEFHRSDLVKRLQAARDAKKGGSKTKTLQGCPKLGGKPNRLEGKDGATIKQVMKKYIKKPKIEPGDVAKIRKELHTKNVKTAKGLTVSHSQVQSWLNSMRL